MSTMKNDMDKNDKSHTSSSKDISGEKSMEKAAVRSKSSSKKGLRWTAIDTAILLLVLLAVAGVVVRSVMDYASTKDEATATRYYVEFTVKEIHASVLDEIRTSDTFYVYETGETVGYLGAYDDGTRALKSVGSASSDNTNLVSAEGCMICTEGVLKNGSLLVEGMNSYLSPGVVLNLRTDRAVLTVEITAIRTGE